MVNCDGCSAPCCRRTMVLAHPELGDDISAMQVERVDTPHGFIWQLKRKENGDCVHLENGLCGIYERRPAMCRKFDCVDAMRKAIAGMFQMDALHPEVMREALKRGG